MDRTILILTSNWLLHQDSQSAFFACILASMKAGDILLQWLNSEKQPEPYGLSITSDQFDLSDNKLPDNSVAVIPVVGTLYSWKTARIRYHLAEAIAHPKINSIILAIDSPGGMVSGIDLLEKEIRTSSKPVGAYCSHLCASAAQWIASACKPVVASSPMDVFGSIGVMTTFISFSKLFENFGIDIKEIYATKSTHKNHAHKEALKDNFEPIVEDLDYTNNLFHQTIAGNLGIDLESEVFSGDVYRAKTAIQHKLIHSIGTLEDTVKAVYEKGMIAKANKFTI